MKNWTYEIHLPPKLGISSYTGSITVNSKVRFFGISGLRLLRMEKISKIIKNYEQ